MQIAALAANREILKEINLRFDVLNRLADNSELRRQLIAIGHSPADEALWDQLEEWLKARNMEYDQQAPADSWFINDSRGVQVARSPRSDASRGENYSHRDYFHGRGANPPPLGSEAAPITGPHLSAVYRSTSSSRLKVAFSIPIENGRSGAQRKIIGVLAMAVDLGEFNVLEKQLPAGQEVVLIDLRESNVDDQLRRGLVLHHQRESVYRRDQPPPWIDSRLLERIDARLADVRAGEGAMLLNYRDEALTDGRLYWGALRPVVDERLEGQVHDTRWLVLVQEPIAP